MKPAPSAPKDIVKSDMGFEARIRDSIRNLRRRSLHPDLQRHAYWVQGRELTPVQVDTLQTLVQERAWRIKDLAAAIGVDPSQTSRIIAGLIDMGLAQRDQAPNDRRNAQVSATDGGRAWAQEIACRLDQLTRRVVERLAPDRQRLFTELLEEYLGAVEYVRNELVAESKIPPVRRPK